MVSFTKDILILITDNTNNKLTSLHSHAPHLADYDPKCWVAFTWKNTSIWYKSLNLSHGKVRISEPN
jgi:hypothetical protein